MKDNQDKPQSERSESVLLDIVTLVLVLLLLCDGVTMFLGISNAIDAQGWFQWLFTFVLGVAAMIYVVVLRWLNQQISETKKYHSFIANLVIPCIFVLFFVIDAWSTFESLKRYLVKDIDFQQNFLALLILISGTLVCALAPILAAFYDDTKKSLT